MRSSRIRFLFSGLSLLAAFVAIVVFSAVVHAGNVVHYSFPASWDGTGVSPQVVTDLSGAGNDGMTSGGAALSSNVPPGPPGSGTMSLNSAGEGGVLTDNMNLLENPAIAAAGGFNFRTWFYWDGNDGNRSVQKIIDNEGTESLQLNNIDSTGGTADLEFRFNDQPGGPTLPIVANTWYLARGVFDTGGAPLGPNGEISGAATLYANGAVAVASITRETAASNPGFDTSDELDRPIAFGVLALPVVPTIVNLSGDIYDPSVGLGIPEPASLMLTLAACCGLASMRRR